MIVTAAYPKSGSTWIQSLIHYCTIGEMYYSSREEGLFYYNVKTKRSLLLKKISLGELFYMKIHYAYVPKHLPHHESIRACIYILRHPLDILSSKVNHIDLINGEQVLSPQERSQIVMNELDKANDLPSSTNNFSGGWNRHVQSWMEQKEIPVYMIRYEDLLDNTFAIMMKLNNDLQLGMREQNIVKGCELASFSVMKERESYEITQNLLGNFSLPKRRKAFFNKGISFINKGIVGNYKNVLNQSEIEMAQEVFRPMLDKYYSDYT